MDARIEMMPRAELADLARTHGQLVFRTAYRLLGDRAQAEDDPDAALDWLAAIRDFQGKAEQVEDTRTIDGRTARGWALEVEGAPIVLWADRDGLPLAMETAVAGGLEIQYRFRFDVPIAPGELSTDVPAGYRLVGADER